MTIITQGSLDAALKCIELSPEIHATLTTQCPSHTTQPHTMTHHTTAPHDHTTPRTTNSQITYHTPTHPGILRRRPKVHGTEPRNTHHPLHAGIDIQSQWVVVMAWV